VPAAKLLLHRLGDEVGLPAEHIAAKTHEGVDVLVAVQIPEPSAGRPFDDNRIDKFLDGGTEPRHDARVGHRGAVFDRPLLGRLRSRYIASQERLQARTLTGRLLLLLMRDTSDCAERLFDQLGVLRRDGRRLHGRWRRGGGRLNCRRRGSNCCRRGRHGCDDRGHGDGDGQGRGGGRASTQS